MCRLCVNVLPCVCVCLVYLSHYTNSTAQQTSPIHRSAHRAFDRIKVLGLQCDVFHVSVGLGSFAATVDLVRWNQSGLATTHVSQH